MIACIFQCMFFAFEYVNMKAFWIESNSVSINVKYYSWTWMLSVCARFSVCVRISHSLWKPGRIYICYYCSARHWQGHRRPSWATLWCDFPRVLHLSGLTLEPSSSQEMILKQLSVKQTGIIFYSGRTTLFMMSPHLWRDGPWMHSHETMPTVVKNDMRFKGEGHRRLETWWDHTKRVCGGMGQSATLLFESISCKFSC